MNHTLRNLTLAAALLTGANGCNTPNSKPDPEATRHQELLEEVKRTRFAIEQGSREHQKGSREDLEKSISAREAALRIEQIRFNLFQELERAKISGNEPFVGMGFEYAVRTQASTQRSDVVVIEVLPGSPAEIAGLKTGDRIVIINNQPINALKTPDVLEIFSKGKPGETAELSIKRDGKTETITITRELLQVKRSVEILSPKRGE